jgi:tetratricopeptide (TPR) repeat protein
MTRPTTTSRRLLTLAILATAALATPTLATTARAQDPLYERAPKRPTLDEAGADTNDWQSYFRYGVKHIQKRPDRASAAFYWASRLAPDRAEPIYGRWVATWISRRTMLAAYVNGSAADTPEARAVDSLQTAALVRDPFVHQGLRRSLEGAMNDRQYGEGKWVWEDTDENRAWLAYTEGKFDESAKIFAQAIRRKRTRTDLHVARARAFYGAAKLDSAVAEMTIALDEMRLHDQKHLVYSYDSKAMFEYSLGVLHRMRKDYAAAKAAYGRALEEELTFHIAHAALGGLALAQGDTAQAISAFEDAITANPNDPVIRHDLGVLLLGARRPAEALPHLREAVRLAPEFANAHYNYAAALEVVGRPEDAAVQYAEFVARAPRSLSGSADAARARIAAIGAR